MTKLFLALIIGVALIGASTVFAVTMGHNGGHGCPVSLSPVGDCPPSSSILFLAAHHVSQLQNLTQTTAGWNLGLLQGILIIVLFTGIHRVLKNNKNIGSLVFQKPVFVPVRKLFAWLILKNRRNPATVFSGA